MLKVTPQKYISLFKVENETSIVIYAVCVLVTAPGEYQLSEPRIVKVTFKNPARLPGKVLSPFLLINGLVVDSSFVATKNTLPRVSSSYKQSDILKWYSANAPNSFALF